MEDVITAKGPGYVRQADHVGDTLLSQGTRQAIYVTLALVRDASVLVLTDASTRYAYCAVRPPGRCGGVGMNRRTWGRVDRTWLIGSNRVWILKGVSHAVLCVAGHHAGHCGGASYIEEEEDEEEEGVPAGLDRAKLKKIEGGEDVAKGCANHPRTLIRRTELSLGFCFVETGFTSLRMVLEVRHVVMT
jgi:hypothetical protein